MQEIERLSQVVSIVEEHDYLEVSKLESLLKQAEKEYASYREKIPQSLYSKDETLLYLDDVVKALQICVSEAVIRDDFNKQLEAEGVKSIAEKLFAELQKIEDTASKELYVIVDGKATVSPAFTVMLKIAMLNKELNAA
tara:strand:+ start:1138 stop:1554 length:417 start_codon:yes stop_codon:yes gene_type:complete